MKATVTYICLGLASACARSAPADETYIVTETAASSSVRCGPIVPVAAPEDVCEGLGGVAQVVRGPDWYDFGCRDGFVAWGHVEGDRAWFDLTTDECESEYEMVRK